MKMIFNKIITFSFIAVFAILLLITLISIKNSKEYLVISQELQSTNLFMQDLESLQSETADLVAAYRGYAINGDHIFVDNFNQSLNKMSVTESLVKNYSATDIHLSEQIDSLLTHCQLLKDFGHSIIETRNLLDEGYLAELIITRKGLTSKNKIDRLIDEIEEQGRKELRHLENEQQQLAQNATNVNFFLAVFCLIVLVIIFEKLHREFSKRIVAEAQLSSINKSLEEQVKIKTEEITNIFDRITDAFIAYDNDWRYTYINNKAADLLNLDRYKIIGKNVWKEFPELKAQAIYAAHKQALEKQHYVYIESYLPKKKKWFENHLYPSKEGVTVFFRDITERKATEEALNQSKIFIETLINATPDMIYIYDLEENKNVYINKGAEKNLGYSSAEIRQMGDQVLTTLMHPEDFKQYLQHTLPKYQSTKDKEIISHEFRMRDKSGNWHWLYCKETIFLRDSEGKPKQIFGITSDVTERKNAEKEIVKVLKEKETVLNRINDGMISVDNDWRYTFLNDAALETHPLGREGTLGKVIWDVHPELEGTVFWDKYREAMESRNVIEVESYYPPIDKWFSVKVYPSEDGLTIYYKDITLRKKAEEQITSEKILSDTIINSLPGIFYLYDRNGKFLRWNKNFETVSGYSAEEIQQLHPLDFFDTDEKELIKNKIGNVFVSGKDEVDAHFLTKSGEKIPYYFNGWASTFENKPCLIGVGLDITERKKISEELKENELRYKAAEKQGKLGHWELNLHNNQLIWSDEVYTIFEFNRTVTHPDYNLFFNHVHPDDQEYFQDHQDKALVGIKPLNVVHRIISAKGNIKYLHEMAELTYDDEGKPIKLAGIVQDITDSKIAENQLVESEQKYRHLFENNPMPMWIIDKSQTQFLDVNEAAIKHYGYSHEEFLSMTAIDIRPEEDKELFRAVFQSNKSVQDHSAIWRHLKKDGTAIIADIMAHDFQYDNTPARLVLVNDITEKLIAQEELKKSYQHLQLLTAHLQTIREEERTSISREIHDELGQQLAGLKMDVAWMNKKIKFDDSKVSNKLSDMLLLIDEAIKTVRRISTELRPGILDDFGLLVALEHYSSEFSKRSGIKCNFQSTVTELNLDKNLSVNIYRIFQEALTNVARHAKATKVDSQLEKVDNNLILTIKDNGTGFDHKKTSLNKTLGLVGMRERTIIFNGEFSIDSIERKGTTVVVSIPLQNAQDEKL
jgi:PAS domain S-box-containing protein